MRSISQNVCRGKKIDIYRLSISFCSFLIIPLLFVFSSDQIEKPTKNIEDVKKPNTAFLGNKTVNLHHANKDSRDKDNHKKEDLNRTNKRDFFEKIELFFIAEDAIRQLTEKTYEELQKGCNADNNRDLEHIEKESVFSETYQEEDLEPVDFYGFVIGPISFIVDAIEEKVIDIATTAGAKVIAEFTCETVSNASTEKGISPNNIGVRTLPAPYDQVMSMFSNQIEYTPKHTKGNEYKMRDIKPEDIDISTGSQTQEMRSNVTSVPLPQWSSMGSSENQQEIVDRILRSYDEEKGICWNK